MRECWINMAAMSYLIYWNNQIPKPRVEDNYLVWPEHKFEVEYCVRCGQKEK